MAMTGNAIRIYAFSYFSVQICLLGTTSCKSNQVAGIIDGSTRSTYMVKFRKEMLETAIKS